MNIKIDLTDGSKTSGYVKLAMLVMTIAFAVAYFAFDIEVLSYTTLLLFLLINILADNYIHYISKKPE